MALRDHARAARARLAHALALAGLREPGAPLPPTATAGAPVPPPWPAPGPHHGRPAPLLAGDATRSRARREALILPLLVVLIGVSLARPASAAEGGRAVPDTLPPPSAVTASPALRRSFGCGRDPGPGPGFGPGPRRRPPRPPPHAARFAAGILAWAAAAIGRASLRQHRRGRLGLRLARAGLALARLCNRWSLALVARALRNGKEKGVPMDEGSGRRAARTPSR